MSQKSLSLGPFVGSMISVRAECGDGVCKGSFSRVLLAIGTLFATGEGSFWWSNDSVKNCPRFILNVVRCPVGFEYNHGTHARVLTNG